MFFRTYSTSPWLFLKITYFLLLPSCFSLPQSTSTGSSSCKALPNTPSWPSKTHWKALNASISGQLLAPLPPAAVCDTSLPEFSNASCAYVASQWTSTDFHAEDPVSVDWTNWENDACLPNSEYRCDLSQFPAYVVSATLGVHVKSAVDFARKNNVRLIVKGTGHDFLGRSTAPNSLSIWTHNLRGIQFYDGFVPKGCSADPLPAVKIAAGHRMAEVYEAAAARNAIIVGGDDAGVGIGGYLTGGGHSPLSGQYGLAADNVLEMEVVTPSGDIQTLNQRSNPDLFFAFRGGGGSTFGVLLSATVKTFPMPSLSWSYFTITQTTPGTGTQNGSFWDATAYFHSQLPSLVKAGVMGYYNLTKIPTNTSSTAFQLCGGLTILNATIPAFNKIFNPVLDHLSTTYNVKVTSSTQSAPNFYNWWRTYYPGEPVGYIDTILGGRLLDEKALSTPLPTLAQSLSSAYPSPGYLMFNLVSGPGVWNAEPPGGLGSMVPAWRTTVVEMIVIAAWEPLDAAGKASQSNLLTNTWMAALRRLAPDTGTYLNEADPNEPDLPQAYWGANYPRLLNLKRRYDPEGVFWCAPCVGSGDWELVGGRLCRA